VSARNSRAAMTVRRTGRQDRRRGDVAPGSGRARIAEAVHQAVRDATGGDGYGMCHLYVRELFRLCRPGVSARSFHSA
jgi:hypothetical protein